MFLYEISKLQYLRDDYKVARVIFAEYCYVKLSTDSNFLRRIVFSDKCVFHVSGIGNTLNVRIWGTEYTRAVQDHGMHCRKMRVWCAIHSENVVDLYYFNN